MDIFAGIVLDTAVAGSDFDFLVELAPDSLELIHELLLNHLTATTAGTLKLISAEIFADRGFVSGTESDDAQFSYLLESNLREHKTKENADNSCHDVAYSFTPHFAISALQGFQPLALFFLFLDHAFHTQGQLFNRGGQ